MNGRMGIVTGAGSERGIGRMIALELAKRGAIVAVTDVNEAGAKKVADQLQKAGCPAIGLQMNVASCASVRHAIESVAQQFGKIDILVNNAGISISTRIADISEEEWDRVLGINLKGTFFCTQAVLPFMIREKYGRIVNISSAAGKRGGGVFGGAHYSASKAGILGFSKAVAREMAQHGITVNSITPGMIETDIYGDSIDLVRESVCSHVPLGRPGKTEEVAAAVAFLASEAASYITGEEIDVNGGLHMD